MKRAHRTEEGWIQIRRQQDKKGVKQKWDMKKPTIRHRAQPQYDLDWLKET